MEADPHKTNFYSSVARRDDRSQSLLHRLVYLENTPRKSQVSTVEVKGAIDWVRMLSFTEDNAKMLASVNQRKIVIVPDSIWDKGETVDSAQLDVLY